MNLKIKVALLHIRLVWSVLALVSVLPCWADTQAEQLALGKQLFTQNAKPLCALCHTLKDAGSQGNVGPVLDELKPDAKRVTTALRNGVGLMPSFRESLSDAEIAALAAYVSSASGSDSKNSP